MAVVIKTKKKANQTVVTSNKGVSAKLEVMQVDNESGDETLVHEKEIPVSMPEKEFTQPTANVGYSAGITKNLGDFNSMKIQVSLHMPCYVHEVEPTFDFTRKFVDDKINEVLEDYETDDFE
ncbi:hypothetical protein [Vibrio phage V-YDF132]|nr:hypothetical protein [Vibrio phage V-YDF132]